MASAIYSQFLMTGKVREREREFMGDLYSIHPGIARAPTASAGKVAAMRPDKFITAATAGITDLRKAQIASHPLYPSLLSAYIECRKVGSPPERATVLEKIAQERRSGDGGGEAAEIGADSKLDEFMDSYCRVLVRYKDELSKPFDEAISFLATIESQLRNLCKAYVVASSSYSTASGGGAATAADTVTSPSGAAMTDSTWAKCPVSFPPPPAAALNNKVGFNMRKVTKGNVTIKFWDLGG